MRGREVRGREGGGEREVRGREGGEREGRILEHCSIYLMEWTGPDLPAVESPADRLQREDGRNTGAHTHTHTHAAVNKYLCSSVVVWGW